MKNKWIDAPTDQGYWWRKSTPANVSMTYVEIRKNNPTFPKIVYFMDGKTEHIRDLPYIQWQKVKNPDEN